MSSGEQSKSPPYLAQRSTLLSAITGIIPFIPAATRECVGGEMRSQYDSVHQLAELNALTEFFGLIPEDSWIRVDAKDPKTPTIFMGVDGTTGKKGIAFSCYRRGRTTGVDIYFVRHDGKNITERGRGIGWEKSWKRQEGHELEPQLERRCVAFPDGEKAIYPASLAKIPMETFDLFRRSLKRTYNSLSYKSERYAFATSSSNLVAQPM